MDAIIVSGMPAVGKTTVAKRVGQSLKLRVIGGGDVLKEMAAEDGFTPGGEDWWDAPEGIRFLRKRKSSPGFDREVDRRLLEKARAGNLVITSYTLPWLSEYGIKLWLSGGVRSRARRMAKRDHLEESRCRAIVAIRDRENHALYKKIYGIEFGKDLEPFDLIIDTDELEEVKVARIVLEYVKNRSNPVAKQ